MKIYDVTLAAGVAMNIPLPGRHFRILTGTGTFQVQFSNGVMTDLMEGLGLELEPFSWALLTSQRAQVVRLAVSDLKIDDNRLAGIVQVVSGERTRVKAGKSFISSAYVAPGVGKYAGFGVFNPVGSGVNVFIESLGFLAADGPSSIYLIEYDAALGAAFFGTNKLLGAANSLAVVSTGASASVWMGDVIAIASFGSFPIESGFGLETPLMLPPGKGVLAYSTMAALQMTCNVSFSEEPLE